ncbi:MULTISPECIES: nicotinamide riboside transporter PnuC [unclassified Microbacterium]|uniref:nicotinamide riboside transporter PnuC n=1 Tax=unclassified Microbacterium TaxID=2609290 RepID=UPI00049356E3|nr:MULTISPECIES: nicotinamide riboside transporter PnuC [unclassified Microbacterium]MCV0334857.1 nicotinamide riboside transporter PnuC [Microbacterium sp.]MCV0373964.1 nicotinamide riboside transporter PnuC [Microbacterium sp.]MCV0391175.1 nicotinamide riboside transporter PnuC [Microbacterium sp.]MCV0418570.1 nicotinamide riboside transporter PnuC [Microbacterium sp.]MCV0423015.1 nicotinamide riboside transporter PnuC [Microbacterium sp.]
MNLLQWFVDAFNSQWMLPGGQTLLVREVVGNAFGLASALGGMRRKVWAWPVGIIGNLLLLTVFLGSALSPDPSLPHLLGQAGRQIMFIAVAIYGWVRWRNLDGGRVVPRWAPTSARIGMVLVMVVGTVALTPLFRLLGSWEPVWADAWTFVGSLLATYGMAKGWTEFWLVWIAVDVVGVPLLFSSGYYATGFMYVFYGVFTAIGFVIWWRAQRTAAHPIEILPPDPSPRRPEEEELA